MSIFVPKIEVNKRKCGAKVHPDGGSDKAVTRINNTPHPMIGHEESVRAINRVMSVCLSLASLKLSDFHQRIKALHFHQICMSPEGNTANIGIICHIVRGIVIIFTQLRRGCFSVRPGSLYSNVGFSGK